MRNKATVLLLSGGDGGCDSEYGATEDRKVGGALEKMILQGEFQVTLVNALARHFLEFKGLCFSMLLHILAENILSFAKKQFCFQ